MNNFNLPNFNQPNFLPDLDVLERARREAIQKQEEQRIAALQTADATTRTADSVDKLNGEVEALRTGLELERQERLSVDSSHEIGIDDANSTSKKAKKKANWAIIIAACAVLVNILSNLDKMIANAEIAINFIRRILGL